jgi:hypothetical protein
MRIRLAVSHLASVIVCHLNIVGVAVRKPEANSPLLIHGDRIPALSVPFQFMKSIFILDRAVGLLAVGVLLDGLTLSTALTAG